MKKAEHNHGSAKLNGEEKQIKDRIAALLEKHYGFAEPRTVQSLYELLVSRKKSTE